MKKLSTVILLLSLTFFGQAQNLRKNLIQRSHMRFPGRELSNICGYVDSLGNEYALVGTSLGMTIVDVTKPDSIFSVYNIPGPNSIWREIKTWQHYAYVATEGGGGLQIVDLRDLPGLNISVQNWTPNINGQVLSSVHALHIDNGFVYLYGSNISNRGIVIGDLSDPWNPQFAGLYNSIYVHDGYVRNDTVWAAQIYAGNFAPIDVSNKSNPIALATQQTPGALTHNTWLSDNSRYLFTTDEVSNSCLTAYDVSDVNNIVLMDKTQSQHPGSQSIVHNTHILNDYAITSWYKDGIVITDCHRPENLINVGYIDSCPDSGSGYAGVWGVYPFLPSGTIVTSDIDSGLYVYTPTYVRACYLEGSVRDSICGSFLNNVRIELIGSRTLDSTDFRGIYKTGTPDAGNYLAVFSKPGYLNKSVPVSLSNGFVTNLDVELVSNSSVYLSGLVNDSATSLSLPLANIYLSNSLANYSLQTDNSGSFSNCATTAGNYNITIGKWGYETICLDTTISGNTGVLNFSLPAKIQDDFSFDYGWTSTSSASSGNWIRATPIGTSYASANDANPGLDVGTDCTDKAFITGNAGGPVSADDVDNGAVTLYSPTFDLSGYVQPIISFSRWFFNAGGTGIPNDSLIVYLSNGSSEVMLDYAVYGTLGNSSWVHKLVSLSGLIPLTSTMQLKVRVSDTPPGHLLEGAFDDFSIAESPLGFSNNAEEASILLNPNPSADCFAIHFPNMYLEKQDIYLFVRDVLGKLVEKVKIDKQYLLFGSQLNSGVYFAEIEMGAKRFTKKIVKL